MPNLRKNKIKKAKKAIPGAANVPAGVSPGASLGASAGGPVVVASDGATGFAAQDPASADANAGTSTGIIAEDPASASAKVGTGTAPVEAIAPIVAATEFPTEARVTATILLAIGAAIAAYPRILNFDASSAGPDVGAGTSSSASPGAGATTNAGPTAEAETSSSASPAAGATANAGPTAVAGAASSASPSAGATANAGPTAVAEAASSASPSAAVGVDPNVTSEAAAMPACPSPPRMEPEEFLKQYSELTGNVSSRDHFADEPSTSNQNKTNKLKYLGLVSSDSEGDEENMQTTINFVDWTYNFLEKKACGDKMFVPCLKSPPQSMKKSALTTNEHNLILKILSAQNPSVLDAKDLGAPTKLEKRKFMALKPVYIKEQESYKEWAKELWTTEQCIRALYPNGMVESLYDRAFRMKAYQTRGYPLKFEIAKRGITLKCPRNWFLELKEVLTSVSLSELPYLNYPASLTKPFTIIKPHPAPGICPSHTYLELKLPHLYTREKFTDISAKHELLGTYARHHKSQFIADEKALQTLFHYNRYWALPISILEKIDTDGVMDTVIVIDTEIIRKKEPAPLRTYRAFHHLLENALITLPEPGAIPEAGKSAAEPKPSVSNIEEAVSKITEDFSKMSIRNENCANSGPTMLHIGDTLCSDGVVYEKPAPRSFKKWRFTNSLTSKISDIIIHSPHKARDKTREVVIEPVPEYQLDLGASELPDEIVRSLALSLFLREKASLLLARIDGQTGEVARFHKISADEFGRKYPDVTLEVIHGIVALMTQIEGFPPGQYVLQHHANQGDTAILFVNRPESTRVQLDLLCNRSQLLEPMVAKCLQQSPTISTDLLPCHKFRKVAPCAFFPAMKSKGKNKKKASKKRY